MARLIRESVSGHNCLGAPLVYFSKSHFDLLISESHWSFQKFIAAIAEFYSHFTYLVWHYPG